MISKKNRFIGRRDPRIVVKHGRHIRHGVFKLSHLDSKKHDSYRAAIMVSKKVSKLAPIRNRIRRRIYEQLRLQAADIPPATDMVIVVFDKVAATMGADELSTDIKALLAKIPRS